MSQSEFDSALPNGIGLAPYLRMKQEGMTENESRIVEWLLKPGNLSCAPAIKDVAEALAVSEAMIVKVSKLLGFSGFRNLRSALEDYFSQSEQVLPSELAFVDEIHRAARFFYQARQRDLYGAGGSNAICADVQHKFLRIGVRCQAYPDAHIMMMSASLLQEGDVVLVVTHSGRTSDVKAAVELAKKNGAKIICITHSYHSQIAKLADYIISSPAPETPLLGRNASARILQLTLLDAFFVSVAQLNIEQANINMQKTGAIVDFFSPGALK